MELKPCPFCGGEAEHEDFSDGFFVWCRVECKRCQVSVTLPRRDGLCTGIKAWNRRYVDGKAGKKPC